MRSSLYDSTPPKVSDNINPSLPRSHESRHAEKNDPNHRCDRRRAATAGFQRRRRGNKKIQSCRIDIFMFTSTGRRRGKRKWRSSQEEVHQQEIFAASLPPNPITEHDDAVAIKSCYTHKFVLNLCSTAEGIARRPTTRRHYDVQVTRRCLHHSTRLIHTRDTSLPHHLTIQSALSAI